jgi:RHS repeat-associated protein
MFCKDVRCWGGVVYIPPIEIGGYKMLDVIRALNKEMRNNLQLHPLGFSFLGQSWSFNAGNYAGTDNLTYSYGDSNRLKKVTDAASATKGFLYGNSGNVRDYEYDKNGNLTADRNKGITNITYNYLNLPMVITFTGNRIITFVYDASGAKLRKIVNNNGVTDTYDYVNGVEYKNSVLQRIAHTEGSVTLQSDGINYMHEYVLRDHLGSARVTFSDANNDGLVTVSDIKQINSYYPFGMNMESNTNGAAGKNKYQYTEKELNDDFALNWNDYGARFYDPAVARWWNVDPKGDKMSRHSPYNYCFDNPMRFVDPDGKAPDDHIFINQRGDVVGVIRTGGNSPDRIYKVASNGDGSHKVTHMKSIGRDTRPAYAEAQNAVPAGVKGNAAYNESSQSTGTATRETVTSVGGGGVTQTNMSAATVASGGGAVTSGGLGTQNNFGLMSTRTGEANKPLITGPGTGATLPTSEGRLVMNGVPDATKTDLQNMSPGGGNSQTFSSAELPFNPNLTLPKASAEKVNPEAGAQRGTEYKTNERQLTTDSGRVINQ